MATVNELKKALEEVYNLRHGKDNPEKDQVIQKVLKSVPPEVLNKLHPKELKDWKHNPTMKKILTLSLVGAKLLLKNPGMKLDLKLLFKKEFNPKELIELKKLLLTLNKFVKKEEQLTEKEILVNAKKNPGLKDEKTLQHDQLHEDHTSKHNKDLLGVDPTQTGGAQIVVQTGVMNQTGVADLRPDLKEDALSRDSNLDETSSSRLRTPLSTTLRRDGG